MKKIVLALVVLMFAAPAWAYVDIYCTDLGDGKVLVSFDATTEDPNLVRAFGLNIQCDNDANIVDVNDDPLGLGPDNEVYWYWVFPGTIQIDAVSGDVTYKGTAVGEVSDSPDTLPGPPDSNGVTIEMATLYAPVGYGSPNAPDPCGPLVILTVDKDTCITISGNIARAGNTGVVMENPDDDPTVNFPLVTECCVQITQVCTTCRGDWTGDSTVDLNNDLLLILGKLTAAKYFLGDYAYTEADTLSYPALAPWNPCADWDGNGTVDLNNDLLALLGKLTYAKYLLGDYAYPCGHATIDP